MDGQHVAADNAHKFLLSVKRSRLTAPRKEGGKLISPRTCGLCSVCM